MIDLVPEEVSERLKVEFESYAKPKGTTPTLCRDAREVIDKLISDVEIVLEANKELTALLSKKYHGDKKIHDIVARLKKKGAN